MTTERRTTNGCLSGRSQSSAGTHTVAHPSLTARGFLQLSTGSGQK